MHVFRKFIRYYAKYKATFVIDLFCAAFISVVDLIYPQLLRILARTLFLQSAHDIFLTLPYIAFGLFLAYAVQALCKYYVTCQGHIMGAKMERDMRQELFERYESLSFSYYDKNNTGQMMSRLVSDLFDISEMAHHGPENLFVSIVKIAGSFVFLFIIQRDLSFILLFVVLFMVAISIRQNARMQATFMDNRRKVGEINSVLQDSFSGIKTVQAFANENIEQHKFAKGNEAFLKSKKENYHVMGMFHSCNLFFQDMMYFVTLVSGGIFIAIGRMTAGDLAMFALYIGIFTSPIKILVELTEMLQKGLSGFRRFLDVIETPSEIIDEVNAERLKNPQGDIVFDDVSFAYEKGEAVLDHVSFAVKSGTSVALVGPSGGGKTTICSLIPRFYDTTTGSISIGGQDVKKIMLKSLRNSIGIVQQDVYLFSGSIKDNIAYGRPEASIDEIMDAAKKANIHDFIISLPNGYDTPAGERGARLSGGQRQRISIARIFLKDPPILILDEATSALDSESERYIQMSLESLSKNRTTITIAHRLSTIRGANEILVIDGSGIAERGVHGDLMAKGGIYAKYYGLSIDTPHNSRKQTE